MLHLNKIKPELLTGQYNFIIFEIIIGSDKKDA